MDPISGAVTGITITNPGSGYTSAATLSIGGGGIGASADPVIDPNGVVTAITIDPLNPGHGYTQPSVLISGGPALVDATATAYGGVDFVILDQSLGDPALATYHMPTVAFDLPDDPNGAQPTAHVVCVEANCSNPNPDGTPGLVTITGIVVDTPGSGYSSAPGVHIWDGTQFDPVRNQRWYGSHGQSDADTSVIHRGHLWLRVHRDPERSYLRFGWNSDCQCTCDGIGEYRGRHGHR